LNSSFIFLLGLGFIETHGWAVDNKDQISPLGFEIIFPCMINYAEKLNLDLPLDPNLVNMMLCERELTIERYASLLNGHFTYYGNY